MGKRGSWIVAAGAVLSLGLAGCSGAGPDSAETRQTAEPGSAAAAAEALARGIAARDVTDVDFDGLTGSQAQKWWSDIVAGMDDTALAVRVQGVTEGGKGRTARATLAYAWDLGSREWAYEAVARLKRPRDGSRWLVDFDPAIVEPSLEEGEVLDRVEVDGERGDILGAGGERLVTDRPVVRFGIDKTKVGKGRQGESARELAELLGVDPGAFAERVGAAGDKAFVEALVLREEDVTPAIESGHEAIRGALAVPDEIPLAPTREFARPILGTVGPVTAEILEKSGDRYDVGDEVGLSGLHRRYEDTLAGRPGLVVQAERERSGRSRELFRIDPVAGDPLRTTLDPDLQLLAERVLADVGPASALVAVRPSDGHLLAAASGPGSQGYSTATVGQYAPGSTFKVVTSLALLRAGLTPESVVSCPETMTVDGKSFENYDDYPSADLGDISLRTAVASSCNTSFIGQHDVVDQEALARAAAALGLGVDHDLGFPAYFGSVPATASTTGHAASMIGQGEVLASPMAMAAVAASVGAGHTVVPRLLLDDPVDGPASATEEPLTGAEAEQLRELMAAVVTEGSADFLADVPGEPVLAKTGTAEFGTQEPLQTHAWMIGLHGDLAVAAFVGVGESGSHTAGPLLEEFLSGAH